MKLNLGCGQDILPGWTNVDHVAGKGVDVVADLTTVLPWPSNSVDEVLISHTLEHLPMWEHTVREIHRILRPGGILTIKVPFGLAPYTGHCRSFYPCTMDGFIAGVADIRAGLENAELFRCVERKYHRTIPFRYHINHYIGRRLRFEIKKYGRIGKRSQITWVLAKVPCE